MSQQCIKQLMKTVRAQLIIVKCYFVTEFYCTFLFSYINELVVALSPFS